MTEKEKKIMRLIAKVVKGASEQTQNYLLGWAEGAASTVCGSQPSDPQSPQERDSA